MSDLGRPLGGDPSGVLDETVRVAVPIVLIASVFLLFAGHNAPGGGFIGGLVAGSAVFLRYISAGATAHGGVTRVPFEVLLGAGVLLSALTGVASLVAGDGFLEAWTFEEDLPVLGTVKFTATLPFDIGVYLVVLGLAVAVVASLGREADEDLAPVVEPDEVER
ncbi:MnhB domain-containing protein [Actinomarinicola tropica]|uniref:MnhB domain-containing protein n=1 Tax=Actinomarinicola tropica TaxID=2789776 RepID=UPI00189BE41B|nr:MnhB domain-containing protein [Actinomarinicola tropica]